MALSIPVRSRAIADQKVLHVSDSGEFFASGGDFLDRMLTGGTTASDNSFLRERGHITADNGATHIYPGSHGVAGAARADLGSPVVAACQPGSAICFLGSTAHGAGANLSGAVRRGLVIGYSLGWLKPHENPWLAYPPKVARKFSPELAALAGYAQHRPNLGNYEGQCPSVLLRDEAPRHLGAVDALLPDQASAVAAFAAAERAAQ